MNYLDPVAFMQHSTAPIATTHDLTIEFDRDAGRRQIELCDQFCERRRAGEFSAFTVYVNVHRVI